MDDQQCTETYEILHKVLEQNGLGWVFEQVEEEIRLGKTVEREIDTLREDKQGFDLFTHEDYPTTLKKGTKARYPVTIQYSPPERLLLLIDALERAVVNTAEMEYHITDVFEGELEDWKALTFHSEETGAHVISITEQTAFSRLKHSKKLKELLDLLRKEI